MKLRNLIAVAALLAAPAYADNFNVKDAAGTTIAKKSKTISGAESDQNVLVDEAGAEILGKVTASPTANTIGARLKDIVTNTAAIETAVGTLDTALGSPFQANGSIGNTAFGATQSGTWTVQPGNTANTTAWKVDGSAVTQPVSSATLATAAKQPALGTAGTSSADVITVQGRASMTPLTTQGGAADGAAASGNPTQVCYEDGSGNCLTPKVSTAGVLDSPRAGTADRVVTKTSISADTNTTICPTATNPISTEIFFSTAGVGISLAGGTLTQAALGTTASTHPDLVFSTAGTLYTFPVAPTNAITAYGAAGIIVCIQNVRQ